MTGILDVTPDIGNDWGVERKKLESILTKLCQSCVARNIPNATLPANFVSVGYPDGVPEICELLTIVLVNGSVYWSFDDGADWLLLYLASTSENTAFGTGTIVAYGGDPDDVPVSWLLCDGQAVSRTTYADLFTKLGVAHGSGDGSTTFNVPDMRGRMPTGANYADLPNGVNGSFTTRALGATLGAENHQVTTAELATHDHSDQVNDSNSNSPAGGTTLTGGGAANTGNAGSNGTHNNVMPSGVGHYIIKI